MLFSDFAQKLQTLEEVSSRLEMTSVLSQLYQQLATEEIIPASYLLQGRLVPLYQTLDFNLSIKLVQKSLARILAQPNQSQSANLFGESDTAEFEQEITKLFKQKGDLGLVAAEVIGKKANKLSISTVFNQLTQIAVDEGSGSQERKVANLTELLTNLDSISAKYVVRIVIGRLRLGFSTMTLIDALSWAVTGTKQDRDLLEQAYNTRADIGHLAAFYLPLAKLSAEQRQKRLEQVTVQIGVPVMPALCQRLNSSAEIIEKMGQVMAEPKYDGMRVQIHIDGDKIEIFTRNLDNVSHMFPELNRVRSLIKADQVILDGEVIGFDKTSGKLLPFQETITRRRKHDISQKAAAVPVKFFLFDILFKDGKSILNKKLQERKELLKKLFGKNEVLFNTPYIVTDDPEKLRTYHNQLLAENLEGAVIKKIDAAYISGRKGWAWVKIKEEEGTKGKLSDTLDLIIMGYNVGRGKRTQFGLGTVLAGLLDDKQNVVTIAKIGTGISEQQLTEIKQLCDKFLVSQKPVQYLVSKNLVPDFWVKPELVIEVAADELTKSPNHTAGLALRFPRLVKIRSDKSWDQATTTKELESMQ